VSLWHPTAYMRVVPEVMPLLREPSVLEFNADGLSYTGGYSYNREISFPETYCTRKILASVEFDILLPYNCIIGYTALFDTGDSFALEVNIDGKRVFYTPGEYGTVGPVIFAVVPLPKGSHKIDFIAHRTTGTAAYDYRVVDWQYLVQLAMGGAVKTIGSLVDLSKAYYDYLYSATRRYESLITAGTSFVTKTVELPRDGWFVALASFFADNPTASCIVDGTTVDTKSYTNTAGYPGKFLYAYFGTLSAGSHTIELQLNVDSYDPKGIIEALL